MVYFSRMSISKLVLLFSVLLASQASAGKTFRRFIGLPGSGGRVKYSNGSENSKTLIIRHNLPVSHRQSQLILFSTDNLLLDSLHIVCIDSTGKRAHIPIFIQS